jgi:spore coat protein SA
VVQRLKVAFITPGTFPIASAKSSSIEMLVVKLAELLQDQVDVFIFGRKTKQQPFLEKKGSITFYRFNIQGRTYMNQVINQLQELKPDIIQIENRPRFVKAVRLAFPRAKIILVMQSTLFMSPPHIGKAELTTYFNATDSIVVNSHFLKEYIIKEIQYSSARITVNHLGVDVEQFQPKWLPDRRAAAELFKKEWGVTDRKILLYVGRLVEIKGVHHILEAMPKLIKKEPSIVLFIAGSTLAPTSQNLAYVERLEKLAEKVKGHVVFTSYIPHDRIHQWFQIADLLIVPSRAEPFGLVNVEAMATGTPVIATNAGGIPEIIEDGRTGILINPNRVQKEMTCQIIHLLANHAELMSMGLESILRVRTHFTWEHTAQRQLELYRKLIGNIK